MSLTGTEQNYRQTLASALGAKATTDPQQWPRIHHSGRLTGMATARGSGRSMLPTSSSRRTSRIRTCRATTAFTLRLKLAAQAGSVETTGPQAIPTDSDAAAPAVHRRSCIHSNPVVSARRVRETQAHPNAQVTESIGALPRSSGTDRAARTPVGCTVSPVATTKVKTAAPGSSPSPKPINVRVRVDTNGRKQ